MWMYWHYGDKIKKILPFSKISDMVNQRLQRPDHRYYSNLNNVMHEFHVLAVEYNINNITSIYYFNNMSHSDSNEMMMKCYELFYKKYVLNDSNSTKIYSEMKQYGYTTLYNFMKKSR